LAAAQNIDYSMNTQLHGNNHASGGSFLIPSSYGNEGFKLGNGDTASAGERITITKNGEGQQQGGMVIDYNLFARTLATELQKVGR
jgi:hypothetical protein